DPPQMTSDNDLFSTAAPVQQARPVPMARAAQPMRVTTNKSNGGPQMPIVNSGEQIGRNDPCPCGSGKKYKKCHGAS
ncbi:MAG TPA: SEC-C metal-binding domain-containing protein, partial [Chitinispirillaceae bacterium]|nr:SEC-C metal-binding domain-containing protein [Chitinispirillaceae bacterium]